LTKAFTNRDADSTPGLPIESYAGTYRDPWYGDVVVVGSERGLVIRFSRSDLLTGPLSHRFRNEGGEGWSGVDCAHPPSLVSQRHEWVADGWRTGPRPHSTPDAGVRFFGNRATQTALMTGSC
jgi:hypothetical protein